MAGSLKWFLYTTDAGEQFAIKADESNTEAVNGTTGDYLATTTEIYAVPRNVTPRYALYVNAEETRSVKCVCLTSAIYNAVATTTPTISDPIDDGVTLTLKRIRPELIQLPFAADTGEDDGDAT